jgi:hypothetical protein
MYGGYVDVELDVFNTDIHKTIFTWFDQIDPAKITDQINNSLLKLVITRHLHLQNALMIYLKPLSQIQN